MLEVTKSFRFMLHCKTQVILK